MVELERLIPGAHFVEKHGAQTTLMSQLERIMTARNPTTGDIERHIGGYNDGEPKIPSAATHFLSHRDQLNAIYRAQLIFKQADLSASKTPIDMGKIIGEGYKRQGQEYQKTKKAKVILNNNGQPITAYTDLE